MEYITDNLDYHHICELDSIHTRNFVISDSKHYLQHSHGDGLRFVSGNVVEKTDGLLIYSSHISDYLIMYSALTLKLARNIWRWSTQCEQ